MVRCIPLLPPPKKKKKKQKTHEKQACDCTQTTRHSSGKGYFLGLIICANFCVILQGGENKLKNQPAAPEAPVDVSRLRMCVGQIVNVKRHPDADTLYIEEVNLGEERNRTIISGLVKHIPIEQVQFRLYMSIVTGLPTVRWSLNACIPLTLKSHCLNTHEPFHNQRISEIFTPEILETVLMQVCRRGFSPQEWFPPQAGQH